MNRKIILLVIAVLLIGGIAQAAIVTDNQNFKGRYGIFQPANITNFFGAGCSAGQFISDISVTGVFTCGVPSGGGGGGSSQFYTSGAFLAINTSVTSATGITLNGSTGTINATNGVFTVASAGSTGGEILSNEGTLIVSTDPNAADFTKLEDAVATLNSIGGKIFVKAGNYVLNQKIFINRSNVVIEGEGDQTSFTYNGTAIDPVFTTSQQVFNARISSMRFNNSDPAHGTFLNGSGFSKSTFRDLTVDTAFKGFIFNSSNQCACYNRLENIKMTLAGNLSVGIGFDSADNENTVMGARIAPMDTNNVTGVYVNAHSIKLYDVDVETNADVGVWVGPSGNDTAIYAPYLENNNVNMRIDSGVRGVNIFGGWLVSGTITNLQDFGSTNLNLFGTFRSSITGVNTTADLSGVTGRLTNLTLISNLTGGGAASFINTFRGIWGLSNSAFFFDLRGTAGKWTFRNLSSQVFFELNDTNMLFYRPLFPKNGDTINIGDPDMRFNTFFGDSINVLNGTVANNFSAGMFVNSTGQQDWIRPENIADVDSYNIENEPGINTFLNAGGDDIEGNLTVNSNKTWSLGNSSVWFDAAFLNNVFANLILVVGNLTVTNGDVIVGQGKRIGVTDNMSYGTWFDNGTCSILQGHTSRMVLC